MRDSSLILHVSLNNNHRASSEMLLPPEIRNTPKEIKIPDKT